jgi:hypothetical protein
LQETIRGEAMNLAGRRHLFFLASKFTSEQHLCGKKIFQGEPRIRGGRKHLK